MSELHDALKALGPTNWSDIPTSEQELDSFLTDLYSQAQIVIDSVPIPSPDDAPVPHQQQSNGAAKRASDVTPSAERTHVSSEGGGKLQKEWGKPLKVKASDNPLGISMYKMSGKDGRGAWFGRRSVHEGIGFARFKRAMQIEFEKSLAEPGPPGTGNVRGIGAEKRIEKVTSKTGEIQVLHLSAQFPGPTAARDFVTLLTTSDGAITTSGVSESSDPRHFLVVSKPCDHPKTQATSAYVRGTYESVEFIREIPRKPTASQSSIDVSKTPQDDVVKGQDQASASTPELNKQGKNEDKQGSEDNPVEWVMVTRSDPGGGIPRFMVERGTPSSICADAVKFVDWACTVSENDTVDDVARPSAPKRTSFLAGATEEEEQQKEVSVSQHPAHHQDTNGGGVWAMATGAVTGVAGVVKSLTPQVVLDHIPGKHEDAHADTRSIKSQTSFASAEEHWSSSSSAGEDSDPSRPSSQMTSRELHHHKQLEKLDDRKQALNEKHARIQEAHDQAVTRQAEMDAGLDAKASEKHEKELRKHEEKYQKELRKIEEKQAKERKKLAERKRKQLEKDDRVRLTRERDEAREQLEVTKAEVQNLRALVTDLQKENATLVARFGKQELSGPARKDTFGTMEDEKITTMRSRGSSISRVFKKSSGDAGASSSSLKSTGS